MKRIECYISDDVSQVVDKLRKPSNQTRAEFNRQAIEQYIDNQLIIKANFNNKVKNFLEKE